jgi:hypothetical protein
MIKQSALRHMSVDERRHYLSAGLVEGVPSGIVDAIHPSIHANNAPDQMLPHQFELVPSLL